MEERPWRNLSYKLFLVLWASWGSPLNFLKRGKLILCSDPTHALLVKPLCWLAHWFGRMVELVGWTRSADLKLHCEWKVWKISLKDHVRHTSTSCLWQPLKYHHLPVARSDLCKRQFNLTMDYKHLRKQNEAINPWSLIDKQSTVWVIPLRGWQTSQLFELSTAPCKMKQSCCTQSTWIAKQKSAANKKNVHDAGQTNTQKETKM